MGKRKAKAEDLFSEYLAAREDVRACEATLAAARTRAQAVVDRLISEHGRNPVVHDGGLFQFRRIRGVWQVRVTPVREHAIKEERP